MTTTLGVDYESLETVLSIFGAGWFESNGEGDSVYIYGNFDCVQCNGWCIQVTEDSENKELLLSANGMQICFMNIEEKTYMWVLPSDVRGVDKDKVIKMLDIEDYEEIEG